MKDVYVVKLFGGLQGGSDGGVEDVSLDHDQNGQAAEHIDE